MDQIKIGRFIAECRKKNNLTQATLAERLGVTDRAVSKWETGKSMPDSSIMLFLCKELSISVNDLLSGEVVTMDNYKEEYEKNLIEMKKQKEEADKRLLNLEIVIGVLSVVFMLSLTFAASFLDMRDWLRIVIIAFAFAVGMIGLVYALKIEQVAGYYECGKCHHKYVPTFKRVLFAMHVNRTRYMRCPKCEERSWQKKVIGKD